MSNCKGVIPGSFVMCSEGENYCSEGCHTRAFARLKEEVKEARNEAAVVRRAYLHERARANEAVRDFHQIADAARYVDAVYVEDLANAAIEKLERTAYKGAADRETKHKTEIVVMTRVDGQ